MLPSLSALLVIIIIQDRDRRVTGIYKYLGNIAFKCLVLIALLFARLIGGFFYLLLLTFFDFPSWILSKVSSPGSPLSFEQWPQPDIRSPRQDMPAGWVRVSICNTDRISHLDLEEGRDSHAIGDAYEGARGPWERRKIHKVTPEEIKHRVLPWLERIVEDPSKDSAFRH